MKINTDTDTVIERTGVASDGAFRINFNAKMARILSDGIYTNKPQAICRELGCNALDSHVMAGKPHLPIEIHMPTELEPFFHVRDFGLGLDHDEVLNIFTVYGESTKTGTNEAVGQLGLGSKVPFAYCDAFDVVARKNGVERHYSMYKNETGLPSCALLLETLTDQCNGVTVKLPVPRRDFQEFHESARRVFRWFDVRPVFTGISNLALLPIEYEFQGNGWGVLKGGLSHGYSRQQSLALMGPVAYPIDIQSIKGVAGNKGITELVNLPLVLTFNIGDLYMAVSREALSYDDRTQKALLDRLVQVHQELGQQLGTRISGAPTLWDAHLAWTNTFGNNGTYSYQLRHLYSGSNGIKWKDKLVKGLDMSIPISDLYGDSAAGQVAIMRLFPGYRKTQGQRIYDDIFIPAASRTVIVFDDLEKGASSRILKLAEDHGNNINVFGFPPSSTKTWAEMELILNGAPVVMASSLPKNTRSRVKTAMLKYVPDRYGVKRDGVHAWQSESIDLEQGGFYVRLNRWDVMEVDSDEIRVLGEIIQVAEDLNINLGGPIYAARDAAMKKTMAENANWINVLDHLRKEVTARLTPEALRLIASRDDYARVRGMFYDESLWKIDFDVNPNSPWIKFIVGARKLQQDARAGGQMENRIKLANLLGMKVENTQYVTDVPAQAVALDKLYPMARAVTSRWINREAVDMLTEYVNSMDELRALQEQAQKAQV